MILVLNPGFNHDSVNHLAQTRQKAWTELTRRVPRLDHRLNLLLDSDVLREMLENEVEPVELTDLVEDLQFALLVSDLAFGHLYLDQQLARRPEPYVAAVAECVGNLEKVLMDDAPVVAYLAAFVLAYGMYQHELTDIDEDYDPAVMILQTQGLVEEMDLDAELKSFIVQGIHHAVFCAEHEVMREPPKLQRKDVN